MNYHQRPGPQRQHGFLGVSFRGFSLAGETAPAGFTTVCGLGFVARGSLTVSAHHAAKKIAALKRIHHLYRGKMRAVMLSGRFFTVIKTVFHAH